MSNGTTTAQKLGSYVAGTNLSTLPSSVCEKAKHCLLDSLGCMVGAAPLAPARQLGAMVRDWGGASEATLAGLGFRAPTPWAAYLNGHLANLLDYDDTIPLGHPGSTVVPAALAVAEWRHCTGRDLLLAIVIGYEIALRVGGAVTPSPERELNVRGIGTWQIFGAAAAASRLLGLDADQAAHALALAVNYAPVPCMKKFGHRDPTSVSWIKNNLGWASLGGVLAAQHVAGGFTGNLTVFDGSEGFWIMAGADEPDFAAYTEGLGQVYQILDVAFKSYPACWVIQTTLECIDVLLRDHDIRANQVSRIQVFGRSNLSRFFDPAPKSVPDAQFSVPYQAAMLLLRQPLGYEWYTEENMRSPEVKTLANRVQFIAEGEAKAIYRDLGQPVRVCVDLEGSRSVETAIGVARGAPCRPLTIEQVGDKFLNLVTPVLGAAAARQILGLVEDLEQLEDVAELAGLFAG